MIPIELHKHHSVYGLIRKCNPPQLAQEILTLVRRTIPIYKTSVIYIYTLYSTNTHRNTFIISSSSMILRGVDDIMEVRGALCGDLGVLGVCGVLGDWDDAVVGVDGLPYKVMRCK